MQVKAQDSDGYTALQLGFEDKARRVTKRPERGHAEKAKTEPKRFIREVRLDGLAEGHKPGLVVTAAEFEGARLVDVQGLSKGKGFAGVVKRHGFRGSPGSHGASKVHRRHGSIGSNSRLTKVPKGMRMEGRMGGVRKTVRNLQVIRLDAGKNLLVVEGAVPGPVGGFLSVRVAKRSAKQ
jgi:large subunit ribosomal protein L3